MHIILLILGALCFVLGQLLMIYKKEGKYSGVAPSLMGIITIILNVWLMLSPHFNNPAEPTRIAANDTLYVAPEQGYQGVGLVVGLDSTGRKVIKTINFVAERTIPPVVK